MFRVMLVEDDAKLAALVTEYLAAYEFSVHVVARDLMLPGMDGMAVCRQMRSVSQVPILILTAREDDYDEVLGLEQGADDFLNKPVQPRVLLARLRALLRRANVQQADNHPLVFGELTISRADRAVTWRGQMCELSNTEYKLLLVLASAAGHVLSRDALLKKMRGIEFDGIDRSIDNSISKLRRRFDDAASEKIKTVWGEGYLFSPSGWV